MLPVNQVMEHCSGIARMGLHAANEADRLKRATTTKKRMGYKRVTHVSFRRAYDAIK